MTRTNALRKLLKNVLGIEVDGNSTTTVLKNATEAAPSASGGGGFMPIYATGYSFEIAHDFYNGGGGGDQA